MKISKNPWNICKKGHKIGEIRLTLELLFSKQLKIGSPSTLGKHAQTTLEVLSTMQLKEELPTIAISSVGVIGERCVSLWPVKERPPRAIICSRLLFNLYSN